MASEEQEGTKPDLNIVPPETSEEEPPRRPEPDPEDPIEAERRGKMEGLQLAPGEAVFCVMRIIEFRGGPRAVFPVQVFENEERALGQAKALTEALTSMLGLRLVDIVGAKQVRDSGVTAQNLLVDVGVTSIDHKVFTMKVQKGDGTIEQVTARDAAEAAGEKVSDGGIILP